MILLDNRTIGQKKEKLEDISQVKGTQLWIINYPIRMSARCHSDIGGDIGGRYFSTEELETMGVGIMIGLSMKLKDFIDTTVDKDELELMPYYISEKYNEIIGTKDFSKEEWECLLKDGFLGLLKMNCPEYKNNEIINFYIELSKTIEELEKKFTGKNFDEIVKEINSHVANDKTEEHGIWRAIQDIYIDNPLLYGWVMDNGKGGNRIEYLESANFEKISNAKKEQFIERIRQGVIPSKIEHTQKIMQGNNTEKQQTDEYRE